MSTLPNTACTRWVGVAAFSGVFRGLKLVPAKRRCRGNMLSQAAKYIVLMVKIGKKVTKYILGVIPGDARVDLDSIKALMQGTYVSLASADIAERETCG